MIYSKVDELSSALRGAAFAMWGGRIFSANDKLQRHDKVWLWLVTDNRLRQLPVTLAFDAKLGEKYLYVSTKKVVKILDGSRRGRVIPQEWMHNDEQAEEAGLDIPLDASDNRLRSTNGRRDMTALLDHAIERSSRLPSTRDLLVPKAFICVNSRKGAWHETMVRRDGHPANDVHLKRCGRNADGSIRLGVPFDLYDGPGVIGLETNMNNRWQRIPYPYDMSDRHFTFELHPS